jgi:hypothetical protein
MAGDWSSSSAVGWLGWRREEVAAAVAVVSDFTSVSGPGGSGAGVGGEAPLSVVFRERFLVSSIFGADKAREMALRDPFKSLQLQPFVSIAMLVTDRGDIMQDVIPPESGSAYCGGALIGELGTPFHVEGPFLQNPGLRHLSLPVCPDTFAGGRIGEDQVRSLNTVLIFRKVFALNWNWALWCCPTAVQYRAVLCCTAYMMCSTFHRLYYSHFLYFSLFSSL